MKPLRAIQYWLTWNALDDKYREVMAFRIAFELSDDHLRGRAEVPWLGIVVEGDGTALMQAIEKATMEMVRRYGGTLRHGVSTQATYAETRAVRYSEIDGPVFTREDYIEDESRRAHIGPRPMFAVLGEWIIVEDEAASALVLSENFFARTVRSFGAASLSEVVV